MSSFSEFTIKLKLCITHPQSDLEISFPDHNVTLICFVLGVWLPSCIELRINTQFQLCGWKFQCSNYMYVESSPFSL